MNTPSKEITLFEITREQLMLMSLIEENEGLIDPEIEAALVLNKENLKEKANSYIQVIRYCESELERVTWAESQIQRFKKRKQSTIDRLKSTLEAAVQIFGPFEAGFYSLSLRKSEQVIIEDEDQIPAGFLVEKITRVPDKAKIKSALKNQESIPGAFLKVKQNLQIK